MLPAGKFFRKNIAISPNFVYTGRCIGHSSLRRKQVSSPPVQPHPAASRRGRQNCLPRLLFYGFQFCRYSFFQRRYHVGIFLFPGALSVWCLDDFLSFAKITEVMSAVRGTARMTPMLLAMPLMTSVAI